MKCVIFFSVVETSMEFSNGYKRESICPCTLPSVGKSPEKKILVIGNVSSSLFMQKHITLSGVYPNRSLLVNNQCPMHNLLFQRVGKTNAFQKMGVLWYLIGMNFGED